MMDDLIGFLGAKVKVTAGRGESIHHDVDLLVCHKICGVEKTGHKVHKMYHLNTICSGRPELAHACSVSFTCLRREHLE